MADILDVFQTTSANLNSLPIRNGNLIFTTDINKIYIDVNGSRLGYDTIQIFHTEEEREQFLSPQEGFYFVEDSFIMYRYKEGNWLQMTNPNPQPIFFGEVDSFPTIGKSTTLYVSNNATYQWNSLTQQYDIVANKTKWETLS